MNIDDIMFSIIDVETTGLHSHLGNRITEIAVVKTKATVVQETFQTLINPKRHIPQQITDITGISDVMVADSPTFEDMAEQLIDLLADSVLVFHNAPFDMGFIVTQLRNNGYPILDNYVIDTLLLARKYFDFPGNSLVKIAKELSIEYTNAHRALADTLVTKEIFDHLISELKSVESINTLEQLLALQGGSIKIPQPDAIVLPPVLEMAFKINCYVKIKYISKLGIQTTREILPVEVNQHKEHSYLIGYCKVSKEERTFRMDRIINMVLK